MQNNISETMLEVRKAYRLLFDYQNRILNLMNYIRVFYGLCYTGGYPKLSNASPRAGAGSLDNWAWDWLNMYFYQFSFDCDKSVKDKSFKKYFSVFLINDTGFFDSSLKEQNNEVTAACLELNNYASVESSQSRLVFVASGNGISSTNHWISTRIIYSKGEAILTEGGVMIVKSYSIAEFETEEKANIALNDFDKFCHHNGLDSLNAIEKI